MVLPLAATELVSPLHVLIGALLGFPVAKMAWRRGWCLTAFVVPPASIAMQCGGRLVRAIPAVIFLALLFHTFSILQGRNGWRRAAHVVIGGLMIVWTVVQIAQLPMRIELGHSTFRIAGNVLRIGFGVAASLAFAESRLRDASEEDPTETYAVG